MRILKGLLLTSQNDVGQTVYVPVMQPGDIDGEVEYPDVPNTFDRVCVTIANSGSMTYQFFWKSSIDIRRTLRSGTVVWTGEIIAFKLERETHKYRNIRRYDMHEVRNAAKR